MKSFNFSSLCFSCSFLKRSEIHFPLQRLKIKKVIYQRYLIRNKEYVLSFSPPFFSQILVEVHKYFNISKL